MMPGEMEQDDDSEDEEDVKEGKKWNNDIRAEATWWQVALVFERQSASSPLVRLLSMQHDDDDDLLTSWSLFFAFFSKTLSQSRYPALVLSVPCTASSHPISHTTYYTSVWQRNMPQ